jgi:small-conductance mechanosensitive channel
MLVILRIFGVDPATIVTVVGIFGLAASLAAQDILKNFFSGLYLLVERPFQIGDLVKIGDNIGVIEDVGFRVTRLRTANDQVIYVPNATVFSSTLINETHAKKPAPAVDTEDSGKNKED